jgi:hypothetical protein
MPPESFVWAVEAKLGRSVQGEVFREKCSGD